MVRSHALLSSPSTPVFLDAPRPRVSALQPLETPDNCVGQHINSHNSQCQCPLPHLEEFITRSRTLVRLVQTAPLPHIAAERAVGVDGVVGCVVLFVAVVGAEVASRREPIGVMLLPFRPV